MTHALAFNLLLFVWIASELSVFRRDAQPGRGARRDDSSRLVIFALVGIAMLLGANCVWRGWWMLPGGWGRWTVAGTIVLVAGIAFRAHAVRTLGAYFRTRVTILDDHRLVTVGPYARLRHPSYTGVLGCCLGVGLASGSALGLAALLVLPAVGLAYRIAVEERALAQAFPDEWPAYAARTHALVPGLW